MRIKQFWLSLSMLPWTSFAETKLKVGEATFFAASHPEHNTYSGEPSTCRTHCRSRHLASNFLRTGV
ncbi:hypothetical protein [Rufibacter hautae]|uniref:Uncharacterized protein n=1 Tax=Rufibacter hautae TaxID=2595005 RepID=A0A5B6TD25_9BACT|nr:hypothetical protein [Rufibacter hautae]KAA3438359.1 hypothetical protein FOA19_14015 [Rufibacter hautae]